jgi:hypothetical protein
VINEFNCAMIHSMLHKSFVKEIIIEGTTYPIEVYKNGCRFVDYDGVRFMVQNVAKSSVFAKKAQEGWQITWGQRPGKWIYMESPLLSKMVTVYLDGLPKQNL